MREPLKKLCDDQNTTVVVLSGSDRSVLDDVHLFFCFNAFYPFCILVLDSTMFHYRISATTTCGWQRKTGCSYVLQRENG